MVLEKPESAVLNSENEYEKMMKKQMEKFRKMRSQGVDTSD